MLCALVLLHLGCNVNATQVQVLLLFTFISASLPRHSQHNPFLSTPPQPIPLYLTQTFLLSNNHGELACV